MYLKRLMIVIFILQYVRASICQLVVFRSDNDDEFHAEYMKTQCKPKQPQFWSWSTKVDFNILYLDDTKITLSSDISPGYFDIYIDGVFTHTCTFRNEERTFAILFTVFKNGSKIRIASSAKSLCTQSFYDDKAFDYLLHHGARKRPKRPILLRIEVLRKTVSDE